MFLVTKCSQYYSCCVFQGKEWLCLNCQMRRALGASEPPGFPMTKSQPSPQKEVPGTTQKQNTQISNCQEDIPKPGFPTNEVFNVPTIKETEYPVTAALTKKDSLTASSLAENAVASTLSKTQQRLSGETPKGQTGKSEQQPPKLGTAIAMSAPPLDRETGKQEHPKDVTIAKSAPTTGPETGKTHLQQLPTALTSITKSAFPSDQETGKPLSKQPAKGGTSPAKTVPSPAQPTNQDSGSIFGFGGPKTQPTATQSTGSVTGKMFGFGSSFLSSASSLITSAVQDESRTTPPTLRKMSTTAQASPQKTTVNDKKPHAVLKPGEKIPDKAKQTPSTAQANVDKAPSETTKAPRDMIGVPKADLSLCPLCKVNLNMGSKDPPNYNTCTQCTTTVCNQCGFNPTPNVAQVNYCQVLPLQLDLQLF